MSDSVRSIVGVKHGAIGSDSGTTMVPGTRSMRRQAALVVLTLLAGFTEKSYANLAESDHEKPAPLKQLNLEQLGNVEVTTTSKEPEQVWRTPAAIYVLTQEDIRRSGATSIPEVLRLVPGVEVARIDSSQWALGIQCRHECTTLSNRRYDQSWVRRVRRVRAGIPLMRIRILSFDLICA